MSTALLTLFLVMVVTMLLRAPIAFAMLSGGIAYLAVKGQDMGLAAEQVLNGLYNSYVLLAVPLFVFAANLMNAGTISERLFEFSRLLVGRMRGGLAQVDILVSVIFSGMSGSAIADAAGPGLVTIKQMLKKPEYTPGFAGAVVVASATIGPIIPPSIPMVIYALVSGTSVGALFLGGVVPGLLMALMLMLGVHLIATQRNMPKDDPIPLRAVPGIVLRGILPLTLPVVLLMGIYTGAFTPTEAAAVAALHALILAGVVYRAFSLKALFAVTLESLRSSAVITIIIASAYLLNYAFAAEGVPALLAQWVASLNLSPIGFLLLVNALFLVLSGCIGHAAGVCAHADPGGTAARHRLGALRRGGRRQHDDRPGDAAFWHVAVRHQRAHRHPAQRHGARRLALHRAADRRLVADDPVPADRAVVAADHGVCDGAVIYIDK
jgi:C4-dicarboxylate transporter, DctM subunit